MDFFVVIVLGLVAVFCFVWMFLPFLLLSKLSEIVKEIKETRHQMDKVAAYYGPKYLDAASANLAELKRCRRALEAMLPQAAEPEYPDPEPVEYAQQEE